MLSQTEGIVLKQLNYGDTSLIVTIFTREFGLLTFLVKGAKSKSKNSKAPLLRPMNRLNISLYYLEQKKLLTLKEISLIFAPDSFQFGIFRSAIGMFVTEVLIYTISEEKERDVEKYDFIVQTFEYLRLHPVRNTFYLSFFYQYMNYLGINPSLKALLVEANVPFPDEEKEWDYEVTLDWTKDKRKQIFELLQKKYLENIQTFKPIKSIDILESIL